MNTIARRRRFTPQTCGVWDEENPNASHPLTDALALGLDSLWVYAPSFDAALALQREHLAKLPPGWTVRQRHADDWWLRAYRRGDRTVALAYPALNVGAGAWDAWERAQTPEQLQAALSAYKTVMGSLPNRSPGASSMALVQELCPPLQTSERLAGITRTACGPLIWRRPLIPYERRLSYLHVYDKRAMYLAAAGDTPMGRGIPAPLGALAAQTLYGANAALPAGYWHLGSLPVGAGLWGDAGPPLLDPTPQSGWYPTPIIELAREWQRPISIGGAVVWPRTERYLRPWYEHLRLARKGLYEPPPTREPGANAIAKLALKSLYTQGLGWFAASVPGWDRTHDPRYRPDLFDAVIAKARANMLRNLAAQRTEEPGPFAVQVDALYFLTDEASPATFARRVGITLGSAPGSYALKDSLPVAEIRDLLSAPLPELVAALAGEADDGTG